MNKAWWITYCPVGGSKVHLKEGSGKEGYGIHPTILTFWSALCHNTRNLGFWEYCFHLHRRLVSLTKGDIATLTLDL
ncbi:hypothetical protein KZP23_02840 [Echinicola marina]|uniref:hypothetical protein n=1 Tax=Echinicola marina TaxID=2859768 RepID=UPI001CF6DA16|nr:hypothetical protein [Echinicola marina]UCS93986.1 hypothetical protein KZP23_02840 [Echinicola marina]